MSPRRNWDSPTPSLASEYAPPPETKEGGGVAYSPAGKGLGESQFRRLEKSSALCLLCGKEYRRNRKGNRSMHTKVVFVMGVIGAQGRLLEQCANKTMTVGQVAVTTKY